MMRKTLRSSGGPVALPVGDTIPNVKLMTFTAEGLKPVESGDVLGKGKVVLFAVPGAYTPTCNDHHLPGYVIRGADLKAKGVDTIACISVNDAWVMGSWGKSQGADDILMLADGNGDFARAMGLDFDGSAFGLGQRSQRYAAVIEDGVVTNLSVEEGGGLQEASAESVLGAFEA